MRLTRWRWLRAAAALALLVALHDWAALPRASAAELEALTSGLRLTRVDLDETFGISSTRRVRAVHPELAHIDGWISSVGAGVALADLDSDGLANDLVLVEARTDQVLVAPAPGTPARYAPFALELPSGLSRDHCAPMGAVPADLDADGWLDVVVYYWGRRPIAFLAVPPDIEGIARPLSAASYRAVPVLAGADERWFTNALCIADVDGDGRLDLVVGNYFADGARVLDPNATEPVEMQSSMSRAWNGGRNRILRCVGADAASTPRYEEVRGLLPEPFDLAWTLGVGACDLDGDLLPELYFANDFGPDRLLHNRSTPGRIELCEVRGRRGLTTPASRVLGQDSFKGMGVDFGDADSDGLLDIGVSNIAVEFGLQESHFLFVQQRAGGKDWRGGRAPFVDRGESLGVSRSNWCWEFRFADLDNDGVTEILQAAGFTRGSRNRWPELHEVAMSNDALLRLPQHWHRFGPDDELCGAPGSSLYVRTQGGRFVDVAHRVGFGEPATGRGIAVGDVDGDTDLDVAVANQWEPSAFYRNDSPGGAERALVLHVGFAPRVGAGTKDEARPIVQSGAPPIGRAFVPALGASARVVRSDGLAQVGFVDGGAGHSGARSHEMHFGRGAASGATPFAVTLRWRDLRGSVRSLDLELGPGHHTVLLAAAEAVK